MKTPFFSSVHFLKVDALGNQFLWSASGDYTLGNVFGKRVTHVSE
jgi:hypothetical protein